MSDLGSSPGTPPIQANTLRKRAYFGATIGTAVEFFDLTIYGAVAAFIASSFFPGEDPTARLLATYAVFALTFVARPVGSIVLGRLTDQTGRQRVLLITLAGMTGGTALIGFLPTYATIGVAAPIILVCLRLAQSFAAGGEFGSAASMVFEYTEPRRRNFAGSLIMFGSTLSLVMGTGVVLLLESGLGAAAMQEWGWRIPFLLSAPLGLVGFYIRRKLDDTPAFRQLEAEGDTSKAPVKEAFALRRQMFTTIAISAAHASTVYLALTYLVTYIPASTGASASTGTAAALLAGGVALVVLPGFGSLGDRVGLRRQLITGAAGWIVFAFPLFLLIGSGGAGVFAGAVLLGILLALMGSCSTAAMVGVFPTRVRASGISVGYNIGSLLFGGTAPFIATALVSATGNTASPAFYIMFTGALGLVGGILLRPAAASGDPAPPVAGATGEPEAAGSREAAA